MNLILINWLLAIGICLMFGWIFCLFLKDFFEALDYMREQENEFYD